MAGEAPSLTGESVGEAHRILERTQAHHPESAPKRAQSACRK